MKSELRFCANLKWLFNELPFEQRFAAAAQAGFTATEYASPYEYTPEDQQRWLAENGLQLLLINTPTGPAGSLSAAGQACHPQSVAAFRQDITRAISYATALSCPMIHVQAGILPPGVTPEQAADTLHENLSYAAELAEKAGITLVLEPINPNDIPGYFIQTQQQALDAILRVQNAAPPGLLFDIYHCQRSEGDITARLRRYMPYIRHIQVADAPGRNDPGLGEINWSFLFQELKNLNYQGWIGCEYRPQTPGATGLHWIERFAGQA